MKRWTLAGWLKRRFFLVATVPVFVAFAVGGWFVDQSVSRELEALVREELDEAATLLDDSTDPRAQFEDVARRLADSHRMFPMAWRVHDLESADLVDEYGDSVLIERIVDGVRPDGLIEIEDRTIIGRRVIRGSLDVKLAIDGSILESALSWYWVVAIVISSASALLGVGFGQVFGRRVGSMLAAAAGHVKSDRDGAGPVTDSSLPDEILRVATELRRTLASIREESERSRVFVASLAHELRSPIQNLIAEAEVLLLRDRDPEDYRAKVRTQLEELLELGHVVNNLLAFCARTESRPSSRFERFDLGEEVRLRLQQEVARATRSGVRVEIVRTGDLQMRGDREAILRALRNVVANAIDWSPESGVIDLSMLGDTDVIRVTVRDRGPGIPHVDRPHVFEPFFRRDSSRRRRGGYGLGLAIAHDAVTTHGGSIRLAGEDGEGTTCTIELPRRPGRIGSNGPACESVAEVTDSTQSRPSGWQA